MGIKPGVSLFSMRDTRAYETEYFSQPTLSILSTFVSTSSFCASRNWIMAVRSSGIELARMRMARRAPLVLLLMATVATGIPLWKEEFT